MPNGIIASFAALLGGVLIAFINYLISRCMLMKRAGLFSSVSLMHQILNVGYIVALYFIAVKTGTKLIYMLAGGALGITLPMLLFIPKLIKLTKSDESKDVNING